MAQADAGRKSLRAVVRYAVVLAPAAIIALPVSFMAAMLATPVLWRLEPVLGMELAGHSGPSDWILEAIFGITTVLVFGLVVALLRRTAPPLAATDDAASPPETTVG